MSTGRPLPPLGPTDRAQPALGASNRGLGVSGFNYWKRLGWKISLLYAHQTLLLVIVAVPFALILAFGSGLPGGMGLLAIPFFLVGILAFWAFSFLISVFVCLLVLPATALSIRVFGVRPARDITGKVAGSAVALVGSVGNFSDPLGAQAGTPSQAAALAGMGAWLLIGLAINLAACQAGGCLASLADLRRRRLGRLQSERAWRLTTSALLALTAIVSVLLAVLKLAGVLTSQLTIFLGLGVSLAYGIHRPVAWATNKWLDWRLTKRRRKRADRRVTLSANRAAPSS